MRNVSDDEVLQTMTDLCLSAEDLSTFRAVRHYLNYRVPPCCIAFTMTIMEPMEPDLLLDTIDEDGNICMPKAKIALIAHGYYHWLWHALGEPEVGNKHLQYAPCPACLLKKNFIENIPEGCPCCNDKEEDE